ncbi:CRISPR system precrRNA processing endoribonuclease RAMP protein Cas6 [Kallotenue papyrolyticum]|uniref:CRISPR system precrRNA processing endoribonuclease RAMP protein Cas6 n=1 Tax=Kallotenue papyrolyticum TaxID=1325125 RepID=UPI000492277B|nr:CRISPR system precrRNA processing endoribonuclease RAMP protein Cas6 [Kallotenue papyrolyticum]
MPTALVLTLRPVGDAPIASYLGRASHAALLRAVAAQDAALAQRLHDDETLKPFAASDLLDAPATREGRTVEAERVYRLRWCGLTPELDALLRAWAATPPSNVELDHVTFKVESATTDPARDALAGQADWQELIGLERIGREAPPTRFTLHFLSPTTFRSNGRSLPLPLPDLIIGSLLERWNSVAPVALPAELRRYAAACLALGRFELRSSHLDLFRGGETTFTGRCTLVAINRDRYYLHGCATLLRLGFFCGVGAKTGMGFGMLRAEERKAAHQEPRSANA